MRNVILVALLVTVAFVAGLMLQQHVDNRHCVSVETGSGLVTFCSKQEPRDLIGS